MTTATPAPIAALVMTNPAPGSLDNKDVLDAAPVTVKMSSTIEELPARTVAGKPNRPGKAARKTRGPQLRGPLVWQPRKTKGVPVAVLLGSRPGYQRAAQRGVQPAPRVLWDQWEADRRAAQERTENSDRAAH